MSTPPLIVFDIETIPDIPLLIRHFGTEKTVWDKPIEPETMWDNHDFWEAFAKAHEITFPQTLFHSVLSICALCIDPVSYKIVGGFKKTVPRVNTYAEFLAQEKRLITEFWTQLATWRGFGNIPLTLSGYNIASFDLLVLEQRSLVHWIRCPLPEYAGSFGTQSYRYKYGGDRVFDVLAFVSNFDNRNAKVSLGILAQGIGLAGKMEGMDGAQVFETYVRSSDIGKIEEYCGLDVLVTFCVLLVVQHFRGVVKTVVLSQAIAALQDYLAQPHRSASCQQFYKESKRFFDEGLSLV